MEEKQDNLANELANKTGLSAVKIQKILDALLKVSAENLAQGEKIELENFGTFKVVQFPSRTISDPRGGTKKILSLETKSIHLNTDKKYQQDLDKKNSELVNPQFIKNTPAKAVGLNNIKIPLEVLTLIPKHIALEFAVVPIAKKGKKLIVAMLEPENKEIQASIAKKTGFKVETRLCRFEDLDDIIAQYPENFQRAQSEENFIQRYNHGPISRVINTLIRQAKSEDISDIKMKLIKEKIEVYFCDHGKCAKKASLPVELWNGLTEHFEQFVSPHTREIDLNSKGTVYIKRSGLVPGNLSWE